MAAWVVVFGVIPVVCVVTDTNPGDWLEALERLLVR